MQPRVGIDPTRIGPFVVLARLGAGGMGTVYLARSEGGRMSAVKVVHPAPAAEPRFRRPARARFAAGGRRRPATRR